MPTSALLALAATSSLLSCAAAIKAAADAPHIMIVVADEYASLSVFC